MLVCIAIASSALAVTAAPPEPRANAASAVSSRTFVRADDRSGRLVRTVAVTPREIRPVEVASRELPATPAATKSRRDLEPVRKIIADTAKTHDVDPLLVESMIGVESNFDPKAVSHKGAMGLMQLIPATARRFGVRDPYDAQQNIEGGVKYLRYLQDLYKDNRLALAAYNAGEGAVAKYGWIPPYAETQNYVYEVGRRYGQARRNQAKANPVAVTPEKKIREYVDEGGRVHIELK